MTNCLLNITHCVLNCTGRRTFAIYSTIVIPNQPMEFRRSLYGGSWETNPNPYLTANGSFTRAIVYEIR